MYSACLVHFHWLTWQIWPEQLSRARVASGSLDYDNRFTQNVRSTFSQKLSSSYNIESKITECWLVNEEGEEAGLGEQNYSFSRLVLGLPSNNLCYREVVEIAK